MKIIRNAYYGITYPPILGKWPIISLWKRFFCSKNMHIFDEVKSDISHCLYCDACGLVVNIETIEDEQ